MLWPWEFRSGLFLPDPARRSFPGPARSLSRLHAAGGQCWDLVLGEEAREMRFWLPFGSAETGIIDIVVG